jgi:hypothetical protein
MPPDARKIMAALRSLPVEDRMAMLVMSIVEADGSALTVAKRMLNANIMMARGMSASNKFLLAELMRDAADALERWSHVERVEVGS